MNGQPPPVPPVPPAAQVTPAPSKTSGLAIASLVLGILGLTCLLPILGPILALVFGIVALNQIGKSKGNLTGQGKAIAGLILGGVGLVMIPIMAAMLLPAVAQAREKARRAVCMSNEKQIAIAYILYTEQHGRKQPRDFDDLKNLIPGDNVLHCPSSADQSIPSYQLFPGSNANDIIVRENPDDHLGAGGNVAYGDGHVEWKPNHH